MKRLLCTVCDDRFAIGAQVMLHSMRRHLPGFDDVDVKIFFLARDGELSQENQDAISHIAPRARFEAIDNASYRRAAIRYERHRSALLTIEVFRQYEHDEVLFFDSDMLCVGDFSRMFELSREYDFVACEAGAARGDGRWTDKLGPHRGRWGRRRYFGLVGRRALKINTGMFTVGPGFRTPEVYERLLLALRRRFSPTRLLDQWAINHVVGEMPTSLYLLPNEYNLRDLDRFTGRADDEAKILHFAGYHKRPKPWSEEAPHGAAYDAWRDEAADLAVRLEGALGEPFRRVSLSRFRPTLSAKPREAVRSGIAA